MKIDIYCAGSSQNKEAAMFGGCGYVMIFVDKYNRSCKREFSFGLGLSDKETCDFQAVRLALSSIKPSSRDFDVSLHVESKLVVSTLARRQDVDNLIVVEMIQWFNRYKKMKVTAHATRNSLLSRAHDLAVQGMETQRHTDTLTVF